MFNKCSMEGCTGLTFVFRGFRVWDEVGVGSEVKVEEWMNWFSGYVVLLGLECRGAGVVYRFESARFY